MKATCYTCRHASILSDDYASCRYNPPVMGQTSMTGQWPTIRTDDWCSKHAPRQHLINAEIEEKSNWTDDKVSAMQYHILQGSSVATAFHTVQEASKDQIKWAVDRFRKIQRS